MRPGLNRLDLAFVGNCDFASLLLHLGPLRRLASAAAGRRGLASLGGEFGGSGNVDPDGVALLRRGVDRFLRHAGVMAGEAPLEPARGTRLVKVSSRDHYVYAPQPGLFEHAVRLGETVRRGDLAGWVHFVDDPARPAVPCHFRRDGLVVCQRHVGRVERGDCVAHLATDVADGG